MLMKTFSHFLESAGGNPIPTPMNLGSKDNSFAPFVVKKDSDEGSHSNLSVIIDAFNKSSDVKLHRTMKGGQVTWQTLPKKKLYLVGGAVRDHLAGKVPKDYDLATEATPDEIRLILKHAGFTETESQGGKHKKTKIDFVDTKPQDKNKVFYTKGWDQKGNEFVIGAKVNGEEFEIATFREDSKASDGRTPEEMKFSDLAGDAARRDFDINAMYIDLNNPDGPNNKLIDMYGGAHSVKNKSVKWVGKAEDRLQEDFLRALRYIRMVSRFGDPKTLSEEELDKIRKVVPQVVKVISKERVRDEFLKGLEHKDIDPVEYMKLYKKTGLLPAVFPSMDFEMDAPEHFSREKYRPLAIAWILRKNDPTKVKAMLNTMKWTNTEINDVVYLLNLLKVNPETAAKLRSQHWQSSFKALTNGGSSGEKRLAKWFEMHKKSPKDLNAFLKYTQEPEVKAQITDPFGQTQWNPALGDVKPGPEMGRRLSDLEKEKFRTILDKS